MSEQNNNELPSEDQLAEMSRDDKVRLGTELDDVELAEYHDRWPVEGTRAERRAERSIAGWFVLSGLSALAFIIVFIWWPWHYVDANADPTGHFVYSMYNPLIGTLLGLSILAVGVGVVQYSKNFLAHEVAVQTRHDGPSAEVDRQTTTALLADAGQRSGIGRRKLITRSAGFGAGAFGLGVGVYTIGGIVHNPWANPESPKSLVTTPWKSEHGEKVYLRRNTGNHKDISLVRPEDLDASGFETVYPFRESDRENEEKLKEIFTLGDAPVMLIHLRPDAHPVKRKGQEDYNYGQYYAYSKICTHLGCPTSLFEQQTGRLLCPCHQSQFDVIHTYAKPVFGPATRSLPQLPITVDEDGYFVARHDFIEPVGPSFWSRKS